MIVSLSESITKKMIRKYNLKEIDEDIYSYGMFMFLSFSFFLLLTVIIGFFLNCLIESLVFYFSFQLLRKYCGGYHADTSVKCEIITTIVCLLSVLSIKAVNLWKMVNPFFIIAIFFSVIIFILTPVDTYENPLSNQEKKSFGKIGRIILLVMLSIISVTFVFKISLIVIPCCVSIILEGVLLIVGKIKNSKRKMDIG